MGYANRTTTLTIGRDIVKPRKWALLGDSIAALCIESTSGSIAMTSYSWLAWAMARLGWPADIQMSDNFASAGASTDVVISTQLPNLAAAHARNKYERCFISSGTNDTNAGQSLSQVTANLTELFSRLQDMGIIPVHIGILPRATTGGLTDAKRKNLHINAWLANYAARTGALEFIAGVHESVANNATADGYILAAASVNALDPNSWGSFQIGKEVYNYYAERGLTSALQVAQSQADIFEATNNPGGIIFTADNPLLTGGTTAPTGMTGIGGTGPYVTWSKGSRTLFNGQSRATSDAAINNATGAVQTGAQLYADLLGTGAWDTERVDEGDVLYGQSVIEIVTATAGVMPFMTYAEHNGVTEIGHHIFNTSDSIEIPTIEAGTVLTLRTPAVAVRAYGGSGNVFAYSRIRIRAPNLGTGTFRVRSFELRKVIP